MLELHLCGRIRRHPTNAGPTSETTLCIAFIEVGTVGLVNDRSADLTRNSGDSMQLGLFSPIVGREAQRFVGRGEDPLSEKQASVS